MRMDVESALAKQAAGKAWEPIAETSAEKPRIGFCR